jgi:hypothetical protein
MLNVLVSPEHHTRAYLHQNNPFMASRSLKRKWLKTKIALRNTVQQILSINRKRKHIHFVSDSDDKRKQLEEELRVLNAIADNQARMLRTYEQQLVDIPIRTK